MNFLHFKDGYRKGGRRRKMRGKGGISLLASVTPMFICRLLHHVLSRHSSPLYREVQLDFTRDMEVFYMLFERCHSTVVLV